MPEQVRCPSCSANITPTRTPIVTNKRHNLLKRQILWGGGGFLIAIFGLLFFLHFGVSNYGLIGIGMIFIGILIIVFSIFQYIQGRSIKKYHQVCPLCGHHWVRQPDQAHNLVGLEAYFTDCERLRAEFEMRVATPQFTKRILLIHGVGGVGKSSLLRMFRLYSRNRGHPVALFSGDEAKTQIEILSAWAKELRGEALELPNFTQMLEQYRTIQLKVEQKAQGKLSEKLGKTAAQMIVQTAASAIPIVGIPLSILGGAGVEALTDWLHGFLSQPQIEFLLDPTKKLTDSFLDDLAQCAASLQRVQPPRHIILLLDTIEQMITFDNWICDLAQRLHPNILLVIAGRIIPDWNRQWPGWMAQTQIEELPPMSEEVMRVLVLRYYTTQRGGEPNKAQVESIIRFARGLPLAVTSAVQLWVRYGVEDFQMVQSQVVADLARQLTKGVSDQILPVLTASATLRWFNKELLKVIMLETPSDSIYNELRWFPFVRSRVEGLAVHDLVREILDDTLQVDEPQRYREMHLRAAVYFRAQMTTVMREEATGLALEELYHRVRADEAEGIKLFVNMAEELARYSLLNQLRTVLSDANNYTLKRENSRLWLKYYEAHLAQLEGRLTNPELVFQSIGESEQAEPKLQAYALCDWGSVVRWPHGGKPADAAKAAQVLEKGLALHPLDAKLVIGLTELCEAYTRLDRWNEAFDGLEKARKFCSQLEDYYGVAYICNRQKVLHLVQGEWKEGIQGEKDGLDALAKLSDSEQFYIKGLLLGEFGIAWVMAGRYAEGEHNMREAAKLAKRTNSIWSVNRFLRDLGLFLVVQEKYVEADAIFVESRNVEESLAEENVTGLGILWAFWGLSYLRQGEIEKAKEYLERSQNMLEELNKWDSPYHLYPLGVLHEQLHDWDQAESYYRQCLDLHWAGLRYYDVGSLVSLTRVKYAQKDYDAIPSLLNKLELQFQQYEFNDHLSTVRLMQGHMAWDGLIPQSEQGFNIALNHYQHALIYALRFNRFLLDEILSGRRQGTPLQPIISSCLKRGKEGQQMLTTLRNWWQTGINDTGTPLSSSISLLPESITLIEAEQSIRKKEPGNGTLQSTVTIQLDHALATLNES